MKHRIGVLGCGSWAMALVKILQTNNFYVNWWIREQEIASKISNEGTNPFYLQNVTLNSKLINVNSELKAVVESSTIILLVIPSAYIYQSFVALEEDAFKGKIVISAVKGIIPETMQIVADYLKSSYKMSSRSIGVITGPSHAEEIALEQLTFLTATAKDKKIIDKMTIMFSCSFIKIVTSKDLYGVEYAAVLKNIYALGSGMLKGLGYGDNLYAAFIANSTREMKVFVRQLYPMERIYYHSAYLGDLLVTAYSHFSRNRAFGQLIGEGYSVNDAHSKMKMIAEGYFAVKCIYEINKRHKAEIPIINAIYRVLYENSPVDFEMKNVIDLLR